MLKSSSYTALSSEYIPHFVESTQAVFSTILGWDIEVIHREHGSAFRPGHDVSGIISFAGEVQGTIVISVDKEVAFAATEVFVGELPTAVDNNVCDMVAELANMIGGGAKERINLSEIALGLPTTVSGIDHVVSFNPVAEVETVKFRCPCGSLTVQIAMRR